MPSSTLWGHWTSTPNAIISLGTFCWRLAPASMNQYSLSRSIAFLEVTCLLFLKAITNDQYLNIPCNTSAAVLFSVLFFFFCKLLCTEAQPSSYVSKSILFCSIFAHFWPRPFYPKEGLSKTKSSSLYDREKEISCEMAFSVWCWDIIFSFTSDVVFIHA